MEGELPISRIRASQSIGRGQHRTNRGTVLTSAHPPPAARSVSEEFRERFVNDVCRDGVDQFCADDIAGAGDLLVRMVE